MKPKTPPTVPAANQPIGHGIAALSNGIFYWLLLAIMAFLTLNSLLFTSYFKDDYQEIVYYRSDNLLLAALGLLAYLGVFYLVYRARLWQRISTKGLGRVLLVYVACLSTLWIFTVRALPAFDSAFIYADAHALASGDYYPLGATAYSARHPHQLGMVFYIEMIARLTGENNFYFIQMLNVAFAVLAYYFLTGITHLLFKDDKVVFVAILLMFGCLQPVLYTSFIYGQLAGLAFILFALRQTLKFLENGRALLLPGIAVACLLACVFKSNFQIFAIAIALTLLVHFIRELKWSALAGAAAVLLVAVFALQPVLWYYQARTGLTLSRGIPKNAFLAMGLQESPMAPGWFNDYHEAAYRKTQQNYDATRRMANEEIARRLEVLGKDPAYMLEFFYEKTVSQWNEPTYEALLINNNGNQHEKPLSPIGRSLFTGKINQLLNFHFNLYQLVIFGGTVAFLLGWRKKITSALMLPGLCVLGGFFFHLLWEGKSQYIWPYFFMLLPYCAGGICALMPSVDKGLERATARLLSGRDAPPSP